MDCSECQHHYSQNGKCIENKNNCLYYLEEPRGKMLRTNFSFTILADAETPVIKPGAIINIEENGRTIGLKVIRINWINLDTMTCNIEAFYHKPFCCFESTHKENKNIQQGGKKYGDV